MKRQKQSISMGDIASNEFIENKRYQQSPTQKEPADSRIKQLQERNVKLQQEVNRIQRALSFTEDRPEYGVKLPQIKKDVLKNELQNAYKIISQYEYEINKKKKYSFEGAFVDQVRKLEKILEEKESYSEKIRTQINEIKQRSVELTKLLKDDRKKIHNQQKQTKLNADIKWHKEMLRKVEDNHRMIVVNLEKQVEGIKQYEKQLMKVHRFEVSDIENIRNRVFKVEDDVRSMNEEKKSSKKTQEQPQGQSAYSLENELKLFRKLEKDYLYKIEVLSKQKEESQTKNMKSRNKLLQIEYEIQKIGAEIEIAKPKINPNNLKPTKMDMILLEKQRAVSERKLIKPKMTFPHVFKFTEVGEGTKTGKRFIDRGMIGRKAARIIGIAFLQNKKGNHEILGLKVKYSIGKSLQWSEAHILADIAQTDEKKYECSVEDYIKSIDCFVSQSGMVVGLSLVSVKNNVFRGGQVTDNRKALLMRQEEYPVCLYGCLLEEGLLMFGSEILEDK